LVELVVVRGVARWMSSLAKRVVANNAKFVVVLAVLLFVPAGTLAYGRGWLYIGLHVVWLAACGAWFLRRDPALVERRLIQDERGEVDPKQRAILSMMRVFGAAMHVVAGLDRRFGWSHVPLAATAFGVLLFATGCAIVFAVFRANTFTSSIIAIEPNQRVITSGPYGVVRHPFYAGTLVMGLGIPLVLGSLWSFLFVAAGWVLLVVRILAEERFLTENLKGWADYAQGTRSRVVPGVW
jgi:protein-S-isoprenylcysteine O-methyltransferase Ste14